MQVSKIAVSNQFSVSNNQKNKVQNQQNFGHNESAYDLYRRYKQCSVFSNALSGLGERIISLPVFHPERLAPEVLERIRSGAVHAHIVPKDQIPNI